MRKIIFAFLFLIFVTSVFAEEGDPFYLRTSNGLFVVSYSYYGQNQGKERNLFLEDGWGYRTWTPEKHHWECLNYIIDRLRPVKGATYSITIRRPGNAQTWDEFLDITSYSFIIEFTSPTQYIYWFSRR